MSGYSNRHISDLPASPLVPLTEDESLLLCGIAVNSATAQWYKSVKKQLQERNDGSGVYFYKHGIYGADGLPASSSALPLQIPPELRESRGQLVLNHGRAEVVATPALSFREEIKIRRKKKIMKNGDYSPRNSSVPSRWPAIRAPSARGASQPSAKLLKRPFSASHVDEVERKSSSTFHPAKADIVLDRVTTSLKGAEDLARLSGTPQQSKTARKPSPLSSPNERRTRNKDEDAAEAFIRALHKKTPSPAPMNASSSSDSQFSGLSHIDSKILTPRERKLKTSPPRRKDRFSEKSSFVPTKKVKPVPTKTYQLAALKPPKSDYPVNVIGKRIEDTELLESTRVAVLSLGNIRKPS